VGRANHKNENTGLKSWQKENIRKTDVSVSKNYLASQEIRELNRLTTILLDIFEDQLDIGRLIVMRDAQILLDEQLRQLGRAGGSVKSESAKRFAEKEYESFDRQRKHARYRDADDDIGALTRAAKDLPKRRP
jgi:hypothetical protein